jgi:hypothetical protein
MKTNRTDPDLIVKATEFRFFEEIPEQNGIQGILAEYYLMSTNNRLADCMLLYTHHAYSRASLRGIDAMAILAVIDFGISTKHNDRLIYRIRGKDGLEQLTAEMKEKTRNLVVVTDLHCRKIITCFKANKHTQKRIARH